MWWDTILVPASISNQYMIQILNQYLIFLLFVLQTYRDMNARYAAGSSPRRISSSLIRSSHMAWVNGVTGAKCCLTTRRRSNHIYHVHHRLPLSRNAHLEVVSDTSAPFVSILLTIHVIFKTMSAYILVKNRSSVRSVEKDLHVNRICVNT